MQDIKSLLTVPFNITNYKKFSNNFFNEVESVFLKENVNIPSMFKNIIQSYTIFGKYTDPDGKRIIIISVKVKEYSNAKKLKEILLLTYLKIYLMILMQL